MDARMPVWAWIAVLTPWLILAAWVGWFLRTSRKARGQEDALAAGRVARIHGRPRAEVLEAFRGSLRAFALNDGRLGPFHQTRAGRKLQDLALIADGAALQAAIPPVQPFTRLLRSAAEEAGWEDEDGRLAPAEFHVLLDLHRALLSWPTKPPTGSTTPVH